MKLQTQKQIWSAPIMLGALSVVGMVAALGGDGLLRWVSWVALGVPTAVGLKALLTRRA